MRIVHYLNQFFGQIGSESEANFPMEVREGAIGPGLLLNQLLGDKAQVVATIVCGDNYFAENTNELVDDIVETLKKHNADILVAGPAFTAGRYGIACGNVCKIAHQVLNIPAVSGMYEENPGLEMFRKYSYIFPTANNARGMKDAMEKMSSFILKLAEGKKIGPPDIEGYFKRGIRVPVFEKEIGGKRAVDMLLNKINGRPFETELVMPQFEKYKPSKSISDISEAKICVMTSGGIVPKDNPDGMEACFCTKYKFYDFNDYGGRTIPNAEVAHGGFDPTFGNENANRIMPVDVLFELQDEGKIKEVYPFAGVTVGNAMAADQAVSFGDGFAEQLLRDKVDGVILTST